MRRQCCLSWWGVRSRVSRVERGGTGGDVTLMMDEVGVGV